MPSLGPGLFPAAVKSSVSYKIVVKICLVYGRQVKSKNNRYEYPLSDYRKNSYKRTSIIFLGFSKETVGTEYVTC